MKQFLAVVLAALAVTGIYAMTAGAGQQGVSPAKFAKLAKQVKQLKKAVHQIQGTLSCFSSVDAVNQHSGYTGRSTALDFTASGDQVQAYFLLIDPSCVQSGSAHTLHVLK